VALDVHGDQPSTRELAAWMRGWMDNAQEVALLVGGADGLSSECLRAAKRRWSLSRLTLPHALVRVVVAEQCYRAWSLLAGHPYHRD
jgi:23S rRNA (pseudouridine1915-N3)-methyltransferase